MSHRKSRHAAAYLVLSSLIMGCEESDSSDDVNRTLFEYKDENGNEIIVTTGREGQEKALRSFYMSTVDINDENTQKELNLIDELGGFVEYENFKENAEETYRKDMYAKYGMSEKSNSVVRVNF